MKKFKMDELKPVSTTMSMATSMDLDKTARWWARGSTGAWLALSYTSRRHGQTFSSPCAFVHAFRLSHALHIGRQFSEFLGTLNTLLSLGYVILLLFCLILFVLCWFYGLWDWLKEHFWYLSFFQIFSCLLVFSKTIFYCTVHHRGWVCSYC
jgi:hypothetical protein